MKSSEIRFSLLASVMVELPDDANEIDAANFLRELASENPEFIRRSVIIDDPYDVEIEAEPAELTASEMMGALSDGCGQEGPNGFRCTHHDRNGKHFGFAFGLAEFDGELADEWETQPAEQKAHSCNVCEDGADNFEGICDDCLAHIKAEQQVACVQCLGDLEDTIAGDLVCRNSDCFDFVSATDVP
jgi:hypothetical protein